MASTRQPPLSDYVEVGRRFQRSVNLERDLENRSALQGYLLTPAVRRAMQQISAGLEAGSGERAWSLVGPYGSGKSAFAVFFADLVSPMKTPATRQAAELATQSQNGERPRTRLYPVVLTGERGPLDILLLRSLASALENLFVPRGRPPEILTRVRKLLKASSGSPGHCATGDVVGCFEDAAKYLTQKKGAGLFLVVDEAGKLLEFAAEQSDRGDVYLLQALAEAAARSDVAPFVLLTVLHQSFEQYAGHLGASDRNEWAKVQGRFGELPFREAGDQIIRLTASAIQRQKERPRNKHWKAIVETTARWVSERTGWNRKTLVQNLDACWPLHPMAAVLLGPLFRGRLSQNERSLFAFLSAGEPLSFRDFLKEHHPTDLYTVDRLYDYSVGILGSRLFGRDGRGWSEIDEALRRLPADAQALDAQVVKVVGLLTMLGSQVGLRPSAEMVGACVGTERAIEVLERLKKSSLVVYRRFSDSFQLWAGSDLDIDTLIHRASQEVPADFERAPLLERLAPQKPMVARRHQLTTGTLRYFDVRFVEARDPLLGKGAVPNDLSDGVVQLALPHRRDEADSLKKYLAMPNLAEDRVPELVAVPSSSVRLSELVRELESAERTKTGTPELQSDPTARKELDARIDEVECQLDAEIRAAFDPAASDWFSRGQRVDIRSWRGLSRALSDICDQRYDATPVLKNELLNRRILSSSAAKARRNLLEAMILRSDQERLGIEGHPPELSMYLSLLASHGLHRRRSGKWGFAKPRDSLAETWEVVCRFLDGTETGRRPLTDLYHQLKQPPLGLKDGPLPVLVTAVLLARQSDVAIYEHGSFVPALSPSVAERLLRAPQGFDIRQCRIGGVRRKVFDRLAGLLLAEKASDASLLDVVRSLMKFVGALSAYARKTTDVSATAVLVREALLSAREPAKLIFHDLPTACGFDRLRAKGRAGVDVAEGFVDVLQTSLRELQNAYDGLLGRVQLALTSGLGLPRAGDGWFAELRDRARLLQKMPLDPQLNGFVIRAADDALDGEGLLVSLATQVANKPPAEWLDADADQFEIKLQQLARRFRNIEALLVEKSKAVPDRTLLRLAVMRQGQPEHERVVPMRSADDEYLKQLQGQVLKAVKRNGRPASVEEMLGALALAAEALMASAHSEREEN